MGFVSNNSLDQMVIDWIHGVKPNVATAEIQTSDLIETRTLDSMQFLDFVYFVNELCDADVTTKITVDDMRTLSRIVAFVEAQQPRWQLAS
jgi:acyl carrier protein